MHLTRRAILSGSLAVGASTLLGSSRATASADLPKTAPSATIRPQGAKYVRYEDVYRSGDDLQRVINRVTGNRVLTFPEGTFIIPPNFSNGYYDGVRLGHRGWGPQCRGLVGSGRNTVFTMRSASVRQWTGGTCPYFLINAESSSRDPMIDVEFRNFQLQGQRFSANPDYHGLRLSRANGVVDGIYINGVKGSNYIPPGETGSIDAYRVTNLRISNVEIDGRLKASGERVAATMLMLNNSSGVTVEDSYLHHNLLANGVANFFLTDSIFRRVRVEHIVAPGKHGYCFNHEQCTRIEYVDPVTICDRSSNGGGFHMSMNSDGRRGGTDGSLTIRNPRYDATSVGGGKFVVETWALPSASQRIKTAPKVVKTDGTPLAYSWLRPK